METREEISNRLLEEAERSLTQEDIETISNEVAVPTPEEIAAYMKEYGGEINDLIKWMEDSDDGKPLAEAIAQFKRIKDNALVVQSNELAEASQNLTAVELRMVYNLIGLLNPKSEDDFISTKVYIKDLAKICDLDEKSAYLQIDRACTNIMRKPIIINTRDRNGKKITIRRTWFTQLDSFEGEGYIQFRFHPDLRDELLQFHKYGRGYVSVKGNVLNKLGDIFPMRFFNLMIKHLKIGKCEYTIKEIIHMFQLEGKYIDKRTGGINTSLFIKRVVESAITKINEITDLNVTIKPIKVGRKIESIRFFINTKKKETENQINLPTQEEDVSWIKNPSVAKQLEKLKESGFKDSYRHAILGKFTCVEDFCTATARAINIVEECSNDASAKPIQNKGALLFNLIMEYDPSTQRMFEAEEREEREKKEQKAKTIRKTISNAETWESIAEIASNQSSIEDGVKVMLDASQQHPELLERYQKAFKLTYPNETYELEVEICRVRAYKDGLDELRKTPKVNYDLIKE